MAETAGLVRLTSQDWRDRMTKALLAAGTKMPSKGKYKLRVTSGGKTLLSRTFSNYDPYSAAQKFVNKPTPMSMAQVKRERRKVVKLLKAIIEDRIPKKGGRHSKLEKWAEEKANQISCYLAMERLLELEPGLSQMAAGIRIAILRGISPEKAPDAAPAVISRWKHLK